MKEERYFYQPEAPKVNTLPADEADHALRVLRLTQGDTIYVLNGRGAVFEAQITATGRSYCAFSIQKTFTEKPLWNGTLHIAVAPTKMNERIEWFAEKATEIGINRLSFLLCRFSERRVLKTERIARIVIAAAKQSRKLTMPKVDALEAFETFISQPFEGRKYIAHCYDEAELQAAHHEKPYLADALRNDNTSSVLVLIGPEGDFSTDEVKHAMARGFQPISLGRARLRTETAALVALHLAAINNRIP